jgi:hypothetical protein
MEETERRKADLDETLRRVDSLPTLDSRSANEIISYDEVGLAA